MKEETERVYRQRLGRVLGYIQEHLDESLTLEELAGVACFSPFHFHRIFRGLVGEGLMEHVRRIRLERAFSELKAGDRRILDIALDAGYETHESFTRAFRSFFGAPPSRARRDRFLSLKPVANRVHYRPDGDVTMFKPRLGRRKLMIEVEIKTFEPLRVACVRHTGPYQNCHGAWEKLCSWAGRNRIFGPTTQCIGVSYDDPEVTPPEKIRYDACITVGPDVVPDVPGIEIKTIPGGEYAVTLH
ncbi:MAG TPA: GyrI-like domain-containing protein, partial [bacterium]|nr:GyrI-like domain-containing protein [bacterium]